jgi:hypothetical protein
MATDKNSSNPKSSSSNQAISNENIDSAQLELYKEFIEFQKIGQILFQWETQRQGMQLGENHPRVTSLQKHMKENAAFLADIEVELELANIKMPEAGKGDALIHGRVSDENKRGIAQLTVKIEDENGQSLGFAGQSTTDASGYYALVLDTKKLEKLAKLDGIILALANPAGRVVYREPEAIKVAAGDRLVINVTLRRQNLSLIVEKENPDLKKDADTGEPAGIWTIKGHITRTGSAQVSDLTVSLFDKDQVFTHLLGLAVTDKDGHFLFAYKEKDIKDILISQPDLYIKVRDAGGNLLYSSRKTIVLGDSREQAVTIRIRKE